MCLCDDYSFPNSFGYCCDEGFTYMDVDLHYNESLWYSMLANDEEICGCNSPYEERNGINGECECIPGRSRNYWGACCGTEAYYTDDGLC
jgi:hypothetical protein